MKSIQITDLKKFTTLLFAEDAFDKFILHDATFKTEYTTTFDTVHTLWQEIRPIAFSLIKGTKLPSYFKMVLITDEAVTNSMVQKAGFTDCAVSSLSFNICYKENSIVLTTGVAYNGFSLDKKLDNYWDETIISFLEKKQVSFENLE